MNTNKQARRILITSGPAVAEIDRVRKITNHSTGALGSTLTRLAHEEGHHVTLLRSEYCTAPVPEVDFESDPESGHQLISFTDGDSLLNLLQELAITTNYDAVLHAAAVNDYTVDRICDENGDVLDPGSKLASRAGAITLHLQPFTKIIGKLKNLFPNTYLVGWKYETDGETQDVINKALQQLAEYGTDACVANGPAFGEGFGVCLSEDTILPAPDATELAMVLLGLLETHHD